MQDNKLCLVWQALGQLNADMIKNLLASFGIEAYLYGESAGRVYGFTTTSLGEVDIYVSADDKDHAKEILNAYQEGRLEDDS